MGSVKSAAMKALGNELIMEHGSRFSVDFEANKKVLEELKKAQSKKTANVLAGYITKRMIQIEKSGI